MYHELKKSVKSLIKEETNFITNAANFASLLFHIMPDVNWVGFYIMNGNELLLGPFSGKTACVRIANGKGVCGASALKKETLIVDDVHKFPGHIACDAASNSEIVVPMIKNDILYGVLDIDSPSYNRFDEIDKTNLEEMINDLLDNSDMNKLRNYYT